MAAVRTAACFSLYQTLCRFDRPYRASLPVLRARRVRTGSLSFHFSPSGATVALWAERLSRFYHEKSDAGSCSHPATTDGYRRLPAVAQSITVNQE